MICNLHVKLQNCHGNGFKFSEEEINAFKIAAENPNTTKSKINFLRVFANWCEENGEEKYPENCIPIHY